MTGLCQHAYRSATVGALSEPMWGVEARNAAGDWFGEERLVELLTHEMAAGQPPPETVRRLNRAVLEHQGGLLQDDASILLACWLRDR